MINIPLVVFAIIVFQTPINSLPDRDVFSDVDGEYTIQTHVSCKTIGDDGYAGITLYSVDESGTFSVSRGGKCVAKLKTVWTNSASGQELKGSKDEIQRFLLSEAGMLTKGDVEMMFGYFPISPFQFALFHIPGMTSDLYLETLNTDDHRTVLVWDREPVQGSGRAFSALFEMIHKDTGIHGVGCLKREFVDDRLHISESKSHIITSQEEIGDNYFLADAKPGLFEPKTKLLFRIETRIERLKEGEGRPN